jgi:fumarylpyruvate hydrolase
LSYVIDPPARPAAQVSGEAAAFPVRRIYCVGRNYAAHAREMGANPDEEPPFFFTKPADAVVPSGSLIPYPVDTADLHHEVELVLAIGRGGSDIAEDEALDHVYGYAAGLDLTRRDRQAEAKAKARPWDVAKAFDRSAPLGPILPAHALPAHARGPSGCIRLSVDGDVRQEADLSDMIWNPAQVIAFLSRSFELQPGDLIFTGTPEGVGPVRRGETLTAEIDGLETLKVTIA